MVLAVPIVRLIFERGSFTSADTQATALALACFAPGIVGYAAVRLAVPRFYALGTSLTPALVSVGSVGLNIVLSLVLVRVLGLSGARAQHRHRRAEQRSGAAGASAAAARRSGRRQDR